MTEIKIRYKVPKCRLGKESPEWNPLFWCDSDYCSYYEKPENASVVNEDCIHSYTEHKEMAKTVKSYELQIDERLDGYIKFAGNIINLFVVEYLEIDGRKIIHD